MDVKERSDDDGEDEDEEHAEFESLRQFAHFLKERRDDREGGDGKDDHEFIERTRQQQRQPCAYSEEEYAEAEAGEHTADVLAGEHALVVLDIFGLYLFVLTAAARDVFVRQYLAEHLIAAADDKEDIRGGEHHLERQHDCHHGLVDAEGSSDGVEVHRAAGVDTRHHRCHFVELRHLRSAEDEVAADDRCQHGTDTADERPQGLRQRLGP